VSTNSAVGNSAGINSSVDIDDDLPIELLGVFV